MKRKHILLRNEIEMLQMTLREEVYPARFYKLELAERLEELKRKWYKVKEQPKKKTQSRLLKPTKDVKISNSKEKTQDE